MSAPITLMDRSCGGWRVELRLTEEGQPAITLQRGEDAKLEAMLVPADRALDAYWHPCCYLPVPEPTEDQLSAEQREQLDQYTLRV